MRGLLFDRGSALDGLDGTVGTTPHLRSAGAGPVLGRQWLRPAAWIGGLAWCAGIWAAIAYAVAAIL